VLAHGLGFVNVFKSHEEITMTIQGSKKPRILLAAVQIVQVDIDRRSFRGRPYVLLNKIDKAVLKFCEFSKDNPLQVAIIHDAYVRLVIEELNFDLERAWDFTSTPAIEASDSPLYRGFDKKPTVQYRTEEETDVEQVIDWLLQGKDITQLNEMDNALLTAQLWQRGQDTLWKDEYTPSYNRRKTVSYFYPEFGQDAYELLVRSGSETEKEELELCVSFTR
jgi:hypothetical protein